MKINKLKSRVLSFFCCIAIVMNSVVALCCVASATAPEIKNVIFLIPDGAGYGSYDFANYVMENFGGMNPDRFPYATRHDIGTSLYSKDYLVGSRKNLSTTGGVVDSAMSATTLATGFEPDTMGYIAIDSNFLPKATLLEAAESQGKDTGIITTDSWLGATPAAFASHAAQRNEDGKYIARQMLNTGLDLVLGAGFGRAEKYNMTQQEAIDRGYTMINTKSELFATQPGTKIWGNMSSDSYPTENLLNSNQASLAEMTSAAINILSANENGFFLEVEASNTDTGGHTNNACITTAEYIAFDEAFRVSVEWAKQRTDTIVIATPDHDTGGLTLPSNLKQIHTEAEQVYNGISPSTLNWTSTSHTTQNVPVWLYAPEGVSVPTGLNPTHGDSANTRANYVVDIVDIAPYVEDVMNFDLATLTDELFVDVTDHGVFYNDEEKFQFASGDKYVYRDDNVYYKNGNTISMNNKVAVYVNDRFYVPAEIVEEMDLNCYGEKLDGIPGNGTKADPYLIKNVYDFIELTNNINNGITYADAFFKQTKSIDLSSNTAEYNGVLPSRTFAANYDGQGNTINVAISSTTGNSVFPRLTGTFTNLGITGSVTAKNGCGVGFAHTLSPTAKLVNCYSTASVTGTVASGLVYCQYGTISNAYSAGTLTANEIHAVALKFGNGRFENNYYNSVYTQRGYVGNKHMLLINIKTTLADTLNATRSTAATTAGVSEHSIATWAQSQNGFPYLYIPQVTVTDIYVLAEGDSKTVSKGGTLQFSATVIGENNPSQDVLWYLSPASSCGSAISPSGLLEVSPTETEETLTVMAKSAIDGTVTGFYTVTLTN